MNRRAIPALIVLLAGFAALVVVGRETSEPPAAVFATPIGAWMPSVTEADALTGSWFCPGVPASGEDGVGGEVVISNRDGEQLLGRFTILTPDGAETEQDFEVEPWAQTSIDVDAFVTASFASVVVEIDGGGGVVEQRAIHPAGDSVAACANETSSEWYFADGFTVDGSVETLILTNPYDDAAVVDLGFATESGDATPSVFQGFTIPPRSLKAIPIATFGNRDEPVIAAKIEAVSGRIVVGRAQHYVGGGRLGYDVSLAAPALRDQFWFADGEQGQGITETYAIYNPTDSDVAVEVVFLGLPLEANFGNLPLVDVPARQVVVFDPSDDSLVGPLTDGRHSIVFSTQSEPSIVVERVMTRPAGDSVATTVVMGAPPRPDGFVASRWYVGIGPSVPTSGALVVYNVDNLEGTITIESVGPAGPSPVVGLTDIRLAPGEILTLDLEDPDVLNRELILTSTTRVFVERLLSRGGDLPGRSGSWALPASDF